MVQTLTDRNLTSHSYNEQLAEKIVIRIPQYYQTMHAIITKIQV
jgi:hypothetical protein